MSSLEIQRAKAAADSIEQAYYALGLGIEAMNAAVEAAGQDPLDVAGPDLVERLEVVWGLWGEVSRAIDALRSGAAALVEYEPGRWGVVPKRILEGLSGRFLGGWQIWVGAVAAVVALIGVWYLVDYYLEIRDAEAKARQLHGDMQRRYQAWLEELCRTDPERCERAIAAYEKVYEHPPAAAGSEGGLASTIASGSSGLAIGILLAMFAFGKRGK